MYIFPLLPIEDIEYAITTQEMDSLLFEIIKFLLQVNADLMMFIACG